MFVCLYLVAVSSNGSNQSSTLRPCGTSNKEPTTLPSIGIGKFSNIVLYRRTAGLSESLVFNISGKGK